MDPKQQRGASFVRSATSATLAQVTVKSSSNVSTFVTDITASADVIAGGINRGAIQIGSTIVWNFALSTAQNIYNHQFKVPVGSSTGDIVAWVDGDSNAAISISGYSITNPA